MRRWLLAMLRPWSSGPSAFLPEDQEPAAEIRPKGGALPNPSPAIGGPATGLIARQSVSFQRPVVLMVALGLDQATLAALIAQAALTPPDGPEPVFLIDHADFSLLTRDGLLFEHFPSPASKAMLGGDLPWTRYAERRLDLLAAKWRPVSIVPFGRDAFDLLSSWRRRQQS